MSHVLVTVFEGEFYVGLESPDLYPVTMHGPGVGYEGSASVLNDTHFNAQFGWLVSGFWGPPPGAFVWIRAVHRPDALSCYLGRPASGLPQFTPLFGTAGSPEKYRWDGTMLHNYYAVTILGDFEATYEIYFGDAAGNRIAGSATPAQMTLGFHFGDPDVNDDGLVDVEDIYAWNQGEGSTDADENGVTNEIDRDLLTATVRWSEITDVYGAS